jgi:uncharacterized protein
MAIETPCIKTCVLDKLTGLCIGCGRTGNEIAGWSGMTAPQRRTIMDGLAQRLAEMTSRRTRQGGQHARTPTG